MQDHRQIFGGDSDEEVSDHEVNSPQPEADAAAPAQDEAGLPSIPLREVTEPVASAPKKKYVCVSHTRKKTKAPTEEERASSPDAAHEEPEPLSSKESTSPVLHSDSCAGQCPDRCSAQSRQASYTSSRCGRG